MIVFWRSSLGILSLCLLTALSVHLPVFADSIQDTLRVQNTDSVSGQLTEESIKNALAMMEKAREQKDVKMVLKYIAPFAYSTVITEVDNTVITINLNGELEHQEFLSNTYQKIKNRKILDRRVDIRILDDGQMGIAVVREEKEYTTENGDNFLSQSVDTLRFGLVNGQPMVVSTTLKGWLAPTP